VAIIRGGEKPMDAFRSTLAIFTLVAFGAASPLAAQTASPFPPDDDAPAAAPAAPRPQPAPVMAKVHRDKLLALLAKEGRAEEFDPEVMAALGIKTTEPVRVRLLNAVEGKLRSTFSRPEKRKDEYFFFYDEDQTNPESPSLIFRVSGNLRLIAAAQYGNGKWTRLPAAKSAAMYADQIKNWVEIAKAN
jgi:hypothetical protein